MSPDLLHFLFIVKPLQITQFCQGEKTFGSAGILGNLFPVYLHQGFQELHAVVRGKQLLAQTRIPVIMGLDIGQPVFVCHIGIIVPGAPGL